MDGLAISLSAINAKQSNRWDNPVVGLAIPAITGQHKGV